MTRFKTNNRTKLKTGLWSGALVVLLTLSSVPPPSDAQAMQRGISVELAATSSAVPVPDADKQEALIITVTDTGRIYFGVDPVAPASLGEMLKGRLSQRTQSVYIKADARAPYASVVTVLDVAHAARVADITLLTTQGNAERTGKVIVPEGIEMGLVRHTSAAKE
jgi:biopolymer transport protein ExbD